MSGFDWFWLGIFVASLMWAGLWEIREERTDDDICGLWEIRVEVTENVRTGGESHRGCVDHVDWMDNSGLSADEREELNLP